METTIVYWGCIGDNGKAIVYWGYIGDNGRENGNYYIGLI